MTYLDNSPVRGRSSSWSELTRRCSQKRHLQKRYWCFWIVAALFPFTLLRMVYLCDVSKEQASEISGILESVEHTPHKPGGVMSSRSTDTELDMKRSNLLKGSLTRTNEASWTTLHERIGIDNSLEKSFGRNREERKRKRREPKESHSLGPQLDDSEGYLGLPEDNEKANLAASFMYQKQDERLSGEHSTPSGKKAAAREKKRKGSKSKAMHAAGHSPGPQDGANLGLPEVNEKIDSTAMVIAEKQEEKLEEAQVKRQEKQDEKPNGEHPTSAENTFEERQSVEAEPHLTVAEAVPAAKEERLTPSEPEEKGPAAHSQADEPKGVDERNEDQEREGNNEKAMDTREADQTKTAEEHKGSDHSREPQQVEVAPHREEKYEEERKDVGAIEEKREQEELKDAEGIEREMVEEHQIQATEQEEKREDGGSGIQEVTHLTQGEQPKEAKPAGECDLFEGDWVWDPEGPLYTNSTCFYMQLAQNCMSNGRPDTDYLHWRWKPRDCEVPRFDARAFLVAFKGKAIGFVGDSLARNQMQSLLCMLSQIEIPKLLYQSDDDGTVRWLYEQHQVTLEVVWSPYLLRESNEGIVGFEKGQSVLYLDELDTAWTSVMKDLDIIVLSMGQWFFKGSIYVKHEEVVGCHYCPGYNITDVGYQEAYQGAVRQVLEKVASEFKGIVIMSTFAISHFEDGPWNEGGQCTRERPLDKEEGAKFPGLHNDMRDIVMTEFNSIAYDKSKFNDDVKLEFLDVTKVSLTRADGHPGPYRRPNPYEGKEPNDWVPNDCLHWCLPGPVDTWNQLLVKLAQRHL